MTNLSEVLDMPWILLSVLPALDIATPQTIAIHQHLYSSKAPLTPPCQYIANIHIQEQTSTVLVTFQSSSSSSGKSTQGLRQGVVQTVTIGGFWNPSTLHHK